MNQEKTKIFTLFFFIIFMQLYCLTVIFKGPIVGVTLIQSQDQHWYIHHVQKGSWGANQQLKPHTEVLKIDYASIPRSTSSPLAITQVKSITILDAGQAKTLTVSYKGNTSQFIKHFVMPLIYAILTSILCIYLVQCLLTNMKHYLIFHLQFTALAYISAGAAGRDDLVSNIINSLAIFLSIVNCIHYCNLLLRKISDSAQKKLHILFVIIGISLIANYILRVFIKDFLTIQIIIELSIYSVLACLLIINIARASSNSDTKYYAKPLFFIFFLGIGPFILFYAIPILLNNTPILPADMAALFLLIVPICLIYIEVAESFLNLHYSLDRMFSHLKLSVPFSIVLSFILLPFKEVYSFSMHSLYFLIIFIASILLLSYKEWIETKNARYMATLKNYNFANFYHFLKTSTQYTGNLSNIIDHTKKELCLMLNLNNIEIVENDLTQHLHYSNVKDYHVIRPGLVYKQKEKYLLVLHEGVDLNLLAIVDTRFNTIPSESIKMLELFLYYVQSLIDNSLKIDDIVTQMAKLDNLHSPRWYSKLWISSSEREHIRLSTEIHDTILQDLIRLSRNVEESIITSKDTENNKIFTHLREEVLDIIESTRDICEYLHPPLIERIGLNRSLDELLEKCQIRFDFLIRDDIEMINDLSVPQATAIYRIIQELLSNANKHSQAQSIHISLKSLEQKIFIEYCDDGIGLDTNILLGEIKSKGLIGMQERIRYYRGTFEIIKNRPCGTVIKISMDLDEIL